MTIQNMAKLLQYTSTMLATRGAPIIGR